MGPSWWERAKSKEVNFEQTINSFSCEKVYVGFQLNQFYEMKIKGFAILWILSITFAADLVFSSSIFQHAALYGRKITRRYSFWESDLSIVLQWIIIIQNQAAAFNLIFYHWIFALSVAVLFFRFNLNCLFIFLFECFAAVSRATDSWIILYILLFQLCIYRSNSFKIRKFD